MNIVSLVRYIILRNVGKIVGKLIKKQPKSIMTGNN